MTISRKRPRPLSELKGNGEGIERNGKITFLDITGDGNFLISAVFSLEIEFL